MQASSTDELGEGSGSDSSSRDSSSEESDTEFDEPFSIIASATNESDWQFVANHATGRIHAALPTTSDFGHFEVEGKTFRLACGAHHGLRPGEFTVSPDMPLGGTSCLRSGCRHFFEQLAGHVPAEEPEI